ncbi:MAG: M20 metallopeptidase family protein [Bacteroidales bacterium]
MDNTHQILLQTVKERAAEFLPEMIGLRRHLHMNPELSTLEHKTAAFISVKLAEYGIPFKSGVGGNGIVATLEGRNPASRTIALRADMDALPINETSDAAYKSLNPGVMHACGHDVHMACMLGAARILSNLKSSFEGSIRMIFQPSEEKFPGGALAMIQDGVLENPVPASIFAQHVFPGLEVGKIGLKAGRYMASTDEVYLTVHGKGGHGATPEQNIDPVLIASHIVVAMQQLVSRNAFATVPTVLSFGRFIAEGRTNVIPDFVKIDGTLRTFDESWRAAAHHKITTLAQGIANSMGGSCDVNIAKGYPFLVNDVETTKQIEELAIEYLGVENVVELDQRMTAEDFAYYSQIIPSCFYRLGTRNEAEGITANLHTSAFDVDERSLETGMGLMAWIALNQLPGSIR